MISIETMILKKYLYSEHNLETVYIPNCFEKNNDQQHSFQTKENIILTVGRIGSIQKANDILLESFGKSYKYLSNWKLILVGPIEPSFNDTLIEYKNKYPDAYENTVLTGNVEDRTIIEKYYQKSNFFCLTSKWEAFPLVFLEAIRNGCFIVSSDFDSSYDITDNVKI